MIVSGVSDYYPEFIFLMFSDDGVLSLIYENDSMSEALAMKGTEVTYPEKGRILDSTNLEIISTGVYLCFEPLHINGNIIHSSLLSLDDKFNIKWLFEVELSQKDSLPKVLDSKTLIYVDFGKMRQDSRWYGYATIDYTADTASLVFMNKDTEKICRAIVNMTIK